MSLNASSRRSQRGKDEKTALLTISSTGGCAASGASAIDASVSAPLALDRDDGAMSVEALRAKRDPDAVEADGIARNVCLNDAN